MKFSTDIDYLLYLVTDRQLLGKKELVATVEESIKGGVTVVQLREKSISTRQFYSLVLGLKELTSRYKVPFIINDRIDVALAVDADGIHIGQSDMPLLVARSLMGPEKIVGVSVTTVEQALDAEAEGADYLGVGAIFPTGTKSDADYVSLAVLKEIKKYVKIPVVAIGGITEHNVRAVIETGVDGVAVVSAIVACSDSRSAAEKFCHILNKERTSC